MTKLKDGIFYDILEKEYHAIEAFSATALKSAYQSYLHYLHLKDGIFKPCFTLGTALHLMILEPHREKEIVIMEDFDGRTKAGKETKAEYNDQASQGKLLLPHKDGEKLKGMVKAFKDNKSAVELMENVKVEVSIFKDGRKSRIDAITPGGDIIDIKSTKDSSPGGFSREILNFNYHIQAAFYLDNLNKFEDLERDFYFIAISNSEPFICEVYKFSSKSIDEGRYAYEKALKTIQKGDKNELLHKGYSRDGYGMISLPNYGFKETASPRG